MRATEIIRCKREGEALDADAIASFVRGATDGSWPDYQLAAMLMAIVLRGMTADETAVLTDAMARSGAVLPLEDLPRPRIDKHSTGGVGDKVSLVLAPIVAACGATVPMMSGRGLGHTGGTLDKLEAIPGFRTALEPDDVRAVLVRAGCCIFGQTASVAPADGRLYALRDVTATVESVALITASIVSKKLAECLQVIVYDVKVGRGAFMKNESEARTLAASLVAASVRNGVQAEALLTRMDEPLGRTVGNALEVAEAIHALRGQGPTDLMTVVEALAVAMLVRGGLEPDTGAAAGAVARAIGSGAALERFARMVEAQGGDPAVVDLLERLPSAPHLAVVRAARAGFVASIDALAIARAALALGAGRERAGDVIDAGVGVRLHAKVGDAVAAGDALVEIHHRGRGLAEAEALIAVAFTVTDLAPPHTPLVLSRVA